ncbi:GMC oxidoreductase [Modestobacter sp. I12A-02662]|uniref:GMC oxidoreductase n=1 Tax=Modestobacter sp. I12A-02662 TaxID=1730496 RepID=UPI0034DFBE17
MILDFGDPSVGTDHEADVCIVGTGPAGLAIARQFLGTSTRVLLVESGGLVPDAETTRLNDGDNVGLPMSLREGRARTFGGTGTVWPGQCIRLDRLDLEVRDWVPDSGWPLTIEELDPFYDRAAAWLGIPDKAADEQAWRRFGLVPPAFDGDLLYHRSSMYSSHPDVGAFYRAEFERADNVQVLLHATAAGIRTGPDGATAEELELRSLPGRTGRVRARTFVVCGGGIENARLLLLSGLGGRLGALGRYLQDHPTVWVDVLSERPEALQQFYGRLGRGRVRYVPRIRLGWGIQRRERVLNTIATLVYQHAVTPGVATARELSSAVQGRRRPTGVGLADLRAALRELAPVVTAGFRRFAQGRPSAAPVERMQVQLLLEQAPNPDSRITLSEEHDDLGLPKASVDWRLTELERRTARVMFDTLDAELRRLGLGHLDATDWLDAEQWTKEVEDAYHPIGTTRMSTDPATGVVDRDLRVHGVGNLYVCGTSVFPTSGYANPTLTIVALAIRLAEHLAARPARGPSWT